MRRVLTLVLAAVLAGALLTTSAVTGSARTASARGGAGGPETEFNVPAPWGSKSDQSRIVRRVEKAINGVPRRSKANPDPTIAVTSYLLDRTISVTSLINACRRGVGARVILDRDIINANSRRLISAFNGDNISKKQKKPKTGPCGRPKRTKKGQKAFRPQPGQDPDLQLLGKQEARASLDEPLAASKTWGRDRSYVKQCSGSCRNAGKGGNMHMKIYLFSKTGGDKNVTMVSSSNLNRGGMKAGWNDLAVIRNRYRTYAYYLKVHRAMTKEERASNLPLQITDGPYTSRFFPIRNAGKRNDPTLNDLKHIGCRSAIGRTKIFVSMFYWKGSRGNYIASQLLKLAHRGCDVNIAYGAPSRQLAERLRNAAGHHAIDLYDTRWDFNNDGYNEVRTHGKWVAVKGTYRGDHRAYVVMTGSQNWVAGSLSLGDESSLNIAKKSAYLRYAHEWQVIRKHSRRLPYH